MLVSCAACRRRGGPGARARGLRREDRPRPPPGTGQPDKFLYEKGTEALQDKKWLRAREYFRQLVDNYPQSPLRPDAKLALGDTYLGENTTESLVLGAERVPRVPHVLPDAPARRLRAVQAGDGALRADARPAARPDADQGGGRGVRGVRRALPEQPAWTEAQSQAARGPGPPERLGVPGGPVLLPQPLVPGRHRPVQVGAQAGPGVHAARRRLLLPGRGAGEGAAAGGGAALPRAPRQGIREERVSRAGEEAAGSGEECLAAAARRRSRRTRTRVSARAGTASA